MRILFLSQVLPYPLDAGPKTRSYFVLKYLAQKHDVTLVSFVRDTDKPAYIAHLATLCEAVHPVNLQRQALKDGFSLAQSFVLGLPFIILRDRFAAMTTAIETLIQKQHFDVIHADQLWMAEYALAAKEKAPHLKLVLDQHNAVHLIPNRLAAAESNIFKRSILQREAKLLTNFEPQICQKFDHVVWVTEEDHQAMATLSPQAGRRANSSNRHTIIPICTDPDEMAPVTSTDRPHRITFVGGLHWPPNAQGVRWFAETVFPHIRAQVPQAVLTIIGKSPPAGLSGPGIEVTGYVDSLAHYLAESAVFIVPLHAGGGMRVKILDAWRWGLPIVSTTIGAEGIHITPEQNILIADTAPDFAATVLRIFQDSHLAQTLRHNGRATVQEQYHWRNIYQAWEEIYSSLG